MLLDGASKRVCLLLQVSDVLIMSSSGLICWVIAGDDSQILVWDLSQQSLASPRHPGSSRLPSSPRPDSKRRILTDPVLAYTANCEISNFAWSPPLPQMGVPGSGPIIAGGEWLAMALGKTVKVLRV